MTDRDPPGSIEYQQVPNPGVRPPAEARLRERSFGSPLLFDLTTFDEEQEPTEAPTVYYLAATLPAPHASSTWKTLAGFGGVILAGVGLGLLFALILL